MIQYPSEIQKLIESFCILPGIGRKTAEKFVFYLLKQDKVQLEIFADNLRNISQSSFTCPHCYNFSGSQGPCQICSDPNRDKATICVVEETHDLNVIENTREFKGLYHVLGGKIDPAEGMTPDKLTINRLIERVKSNNISEIILALNPDLQGEGTSLYLKKLLSPFDIKITLLARGLPMGSDIEYADEVTLSNAIKGRFELK